MKTRQKILQNYMNELLEAQAKDCRQTSGETDDCDECECLWCRLDQIANEQSEYLKVVRTAADDYVGCRVTLALGNPDVVADTETGELRITFGNKTETMPLPGDLAEDIDKWCKSYMGEF